MLSREKAVFGLRGGENNTEVARAKRRKNKEEARVEKLKKPRVGQLVDELRLAADMPISNVDARRKLWSAIDDALATYSREITVIEVVAVP